MPGAVAGCRGFVADTAGVRVRVEPRFDAGRSSVGGDVDAGGVPTSPTYVFAYRVEIENVGECAVRLVRRRWVIRDADGEESVVEGEGVVGYQPELGVGEGFEYESWCPLPTRWGTMEGVYVMERLDQAGRVCGEFEAEVGRFYLVGED